MNDRASDRNAIVVGASGGLGRALWEALQADGRYGHVVGVSRSAAPSKGAPWLQADTTCPADLEAAADALSSRLDTLHLLINCTGMLHDGDSLGPEKCLRDLEGEALASLMRVNALAPLKALSAFAPLLRRTPDSVAATLSAMVGSITENSLGGWYSYRMSKAALNMGLKTAAIELGRAGRGPIVVAIHPGTTLTPLSAPFLKRHEHREPAESAAHILNVIDGLTPADSGTFFNWDGGVLPW